MPHRDLEIYRRTVACNQVLTLELVDGRAEGHTQVLGLTGFAHSKKTGKNSTMIESAGSHEKS